MSTQNSSTHSRLTPAGRIRLIALTGGEVEMVRPVFEGLSARSRWLRFHTGMPHVPPRYLAQLARVVPGDRHIVVAFAGHQPIGHAEWTRLRDDPRLAEVAVTVVDDRHGQGVGLALAGELAHSARAHGIRHFTCSALRDNRPVRRWLERCGAVENPHDPTECTFAVDALIRAIARHGCPAVTAPTPAAPADAFGPDRSTACA